MTAVDLARLTAVVVLTLAASACSGEAPGGQTPAVPSVAPSGAPAAPEPTPAVPVQELAAPAPPRAPPVPSRPAAPPIGSEAARAEGKYWVATLELPSPLRSAERAQGTVRIVARAGMHVNEEYPTSFRPAPDATADLYGDRVAFSRPIDRVACAEEPASACEIAFPIPFTPRARGEVRVAGTLALSVCSAKMCLIERVPLAAVAAAR